MDERKPVYIRRFSPLILLGLLAAALFWILDIIIDVYVFHEGEFTAQLFHPEPFELWIRFLIAGLIFGSALYASFINRRLRQANTELARTIASHEQAIATLNEAKAKYHSLVEQIPAAVYIWELGEGGAVFTSAPKSNKCWALPCHSG